MTAERRGQLLDPAEAEFAEHGFDGASLNRILTDAGMSKGQAYYYVTDKADLYAAVIERALDRVVASADFNVETPQDVDSFWNLIRGLLTRVTELFIEDEHLAELARGIYAGPHARAALAAPIGRIRAELERLVVTGRQVGAIRTDVPESLIAETAFAAVRAIDRWFAEHWREISADEAAGLNERSVEMLQAMCAPPPVGIREATGDD